VAVRTKVGGSTHPDTPNRQHSGRAALAQDWLARIPIFDDNFHPDANDDGIRVIEIEVRSGRIYVEIAVSRKQSSVQWRLFHSWAHRKGGCDRA
jgi:hypothetical protein